MDLIKTLLNWLKRLFPESLQNEEGLKGLALLFGGVAVYGLLASIYYSSPFQFFMHGNSGAPSTWRANFGLGLFLFFASVAFTLHKFADEIGNPKPKDAQAKNTFVCNAFIPSPPQHLTVKVSIEIAKTENDVDKINQVKAAIKAAITRTASTLPPQTERHAIHPLLETAIQKASRNESSFSYIRTRIISLEFPQQNPEDTPKAESDGFVGWQ